VITARFLSLSLLALSIIPSSGLAAAELPAEPLPWLGWLLLSALITLAVSLRFVFKKNQEINNLKYINTNLLEQIPFIYLRIDRQLEIVALNQRACDFFARTRPQLLGQSLESVGSALPFSLDMIEQVLRDQKEWHLEKLFDAQHDCIWAVRISPGHRLSEVIIQLEDITEQIQMESLMIKKDKLATLSRVTTSMIHEINNPLASILQNMQLIHNRLSPQMQKNRLAADDCGISIEKMEDYLHRRDIDKAIDAVRESARRAARVIENLILFSSQEAEKEAFHSLSTLLERALELAAGDFDLKQQYDFRQIKLLRIFDPALPTLRCYGVKLQQAFFALLRFRAEQILSTNSPGSAQMTLYLEASNNHVRLRIEDNGPQISQTELNDLFRPGLRKPNEGLGLCASFFIINKIHNGTIHSELNPDGNSLLTIELPLERPING
jgi:nitrogen-specific signal transduction histidine kinase